MPGVIVIIALLVCVLIYAWRSPEVGICDHCTHLIERSTVDANRWFHKDSGALKCWPDHDDSPTAEPHPYIVL